MKFRRRVLILAFILIALTTVRRSFIKLADAWTRQDTGMDFRCYYTAAWIVRSHSSQKLYAEITKDSDPTEDAPAPDSFFAQVGHTHGVTSFPSYVYPPTLADLLLPFTFLPVSAAFKTWLVLNVVMLVGAGILFAGTPGLGIKAAAVPFVLFLLAFTPTADCLKCGQIPILLLLLLVAGINSDARGNSYTAGLFFALAAAIKLTPLVIFIPFVAMRDWKMVRAIAFWCVVITGVLLAINGWRELDQYVFDVLPKMGNKFVDLDSRSLSTTFQVLLLSRSDGDTTIAGGIWASKILGALVLIFGGWLTYTRQEYQERSSARTETLAIFLLLSCCVAPVSWLHAYVLTAPALAIFAKRAWDGQATALECALLGFFLLLLSTTRFLDQIVLTPVVGIALGVLALQRLKGMPRFGEVGRVLVPASD